MQWLAKQNQKENTPKEWQGKEYTAYEAKQKQRQMETVMRAQRQKVRLLQASGTDPDDVVLAKCKYQAQLNEYSRFSKKMGLKQERERIYYDIQGRIAPNKNQYQKHLKSVAEQERRSIIKSELEKAGIKGKIDFDVKKIDISDFAFDDLHINKDRKHNVSRKDINQIMREADISLEKWNGQFVNYYGPNGAAFIDVKNKNIRTAFWSDEYDDKTKILREVLAKYEKC